ncbi:MAG: hypothetical protein ACK5SH_06980, partial [Pseudomonadota bacterium]
MAEPRSGADLHDRLGALLRQRGSVVATPPSPGTTAPMPAASVADRVADAVPADDWAARIESLRQAQRVREARRYRAERALPGT